MKLNINYSSTSTSANAIKTISKHNYTNQMLKEIFYKRKKVILSKNLRAIVQKNCKFSFKKKLKMLAMRL
jgi:hypothetical protein